MGKMKRKKLWLVLCVCVIFPLLVPIPIQADKGPKPDMDVEIVNPPEGAYYIDVLQRYDKFPNGYGSDFEDDGYDSPVEIEMKHKIQSYWDGEWAARMGGNIGAAYLHSNEKHCYNFDYDLDGYLRIIIVTDELEVRVSEPFFRQQLDSEVVVDAETMKVTEIYMRGSEIPRFFKCLLFTMLTEAIILVLFDLFTLKNIRIILLLNVITQLYLHLGITVIERLLGVTNILFWFIAYAEFRILIAELVAYAHTFVNRKQEKDEFVAALYAIFANHLSFVIGLYYDFL